MGILRNRHVLPRLRGITRTTTGTPSIAINVGSQEYSASSRTGAGAGTHTFVQKHKRGVICVASIGADVADGGYAILGASDESGLALTSAGTAGAGDDGTLHALVLGFNNEYVGAGLAQIVKGYFHRPRIVRGRITAAGAEAVSSGNYSVSLANTSEYTITFTPAFARTPVVVPTIISSTAGAWKVMSVSSSQVVIKTFDTAGTPTAHAFGFIAYGSLTPNEIGLANSNVEIPGIQNEVIGVDFNGTGTAAIAVGSEDCTLTDNGTGDYTLTFRRPFRDEPVVIASSGARVQVKSTPTSSACTLVNFNAGGSAADDANVNVMIFGSFDSVEL